MVKKENKKTKRPLVIIGCAIAIAAIVFSLVTLYGQYTSVSEGDSEEVSLLFVQTSHSGTLSAPDSDNMRTLMLTDVSPRTVFFSDRPYRETGHESTEEFVNEWADGENSFAINPPNAALDIISENSQSVIVLELMNPVYDEGAKTLRYDVIVLEEEDTDISEYGEELDLSVPQSFGEASLFIDSTYKSYHCACTPAGSDRTCTCDYDYHLGRVDGKEFRGYCSAKNAYPAIMKIRGQKVGTACVGGGNSLLFGYETIICTRVDSFTGDGINLNVLCSDRSNLGDLEKW